jgi:hypothetical protein
MSKVEKIEIDGDLVEITVNIPFEEYKVVYARAVKNSPAPENMRGELPAKTDTWPDYIAYGLKAAADREMTLYEIPRVIAVGGPGTHELLVDGEWRTQPGGLYYKRELRIDGIAYPNAACITAHVELALNCIAEYL